MGNANTVISKERKKFASICFGKKPRRLSLFPVGKCNHISRSKALSWEPGRLRIFIKIAERDVKWETGVLTWNSNPWKMEIRDFLYLSQIASYILDIFPLQTGICFLVRNFHRLPSFNRNKLLGHFLLDSYRLAQSWTFILVFIPFSVNSS